MAEQARIIFYLVQKAKANGNVESLRKQCSISCFEILKTEIEKTDNTNSTLIKNPIIKEIAILEVQPGKKNNPDQFCALIRGVSKDDPSESFAAHWCFVRQGDWWLLDKV
jgi:hypothetical protein